MKNGIDYWKMRLKSFRQKAGRVGPSEGYGPFFLSGLQTELFKNEIQSGQTVSPVIVKMI